VPVTKSMRAINKELAMMAYDYFEVVFVGTSATDNVARTEWELGQPAGIGNVERGINYKVQATPSTGTACMFVGKKDGKTLLGIGHLTWANGNNQTTTPYDEVTLVTTSTTKVTFSVAAIKTGLLVRTETIDTGAVTLPDTAVPGVMADSFAFITGGTTLGDGTTATYTGFTTSNSERKEISTGIKYPVYSFPENKTTGNQTQFATYTFTHVNQVGGGATPFTLWPYVKVINISATTDANYAVFGKASALVQKRVPRFMEGGRYREPKDRWTTTTAINFRSATNVPATTYGTNAGSIDPIVPLIFTLKPGQSGIFSFYIEIPVYNLNAAANSATNNPGGTAAGKWYLRTGVGSELYSLDDGIANGGCVFISVGASSSNWIDIEWVWL